jgi:type II secretory pathway component PulF
MMNDRETFERAAGTGRSVSEAETEAKTIHPLVSLVYAAVYILIGSAVGFVVISVALRITGG